MTDIVTWIKGLFPRSEEQIKEDIECLERKNEELKRKEDLLKKRRELAKESARLQRSISTM